MTLYSVLLRTGLASNGTLTIKGEDVTFDYYYDPLTSGNVYSIQLFTQHTEYRFEPGAPLARDFQKFVDFYGSESYAHDIITAGFEGTSTNFPTGKNVDASALNEAGRAGTYFCS